MRTRTIEKKIYKFCHTWDTFQNHHKIISLDLLEISAKFTKKTSCKDWKPEEKVSFNRNLYSIKLIGEDFRLPMVAMERSKVLIDCKISVANLMFKFKYWIMEI